MLKAPNVPQRISGLSVKQRTKLAQCFEKLTVLAFEHLVREKHGEELPNVLTIPYSTAFHYLPREPARSAVFLPGADDMGPSASAHMPDGAYTRVGWPSGRQGGAQWAPEKLLEHQRPILAAYVGMGKARHHAAGDLWQTKQQVRQNAKLLILTTLWSRWRNEPALRTMQYV